MWPVIFVPFAAAFVANLTTFAGLYECPDQGEAYSAAYLGTRETFLAELVPEHRLQGGQGNMEGASHAMFRRNRLQKTVDLMDFFIVHLSWYERRLGRDADNVRYAVLRRLRGQVVHRRHVPKATPRHDCLAVMPFYATIGGDSGHSALESRRVYLNMTRESLAPFFGRIVVCVATDSDRAYVSNASGLDFFDVLQYPVFRPSRLGLATVRLAQQKLLSDPRWRGIRYVFYTESDQIFHARHFGTLLAIAADPVKNFLLPHRVMPAPLRQDLGPMRDDADLGPAALREFGRNGAKPLHRLTDLRTASCCFDRAPCSNRRPHWMTFAHPHLHLFQLVARPEDNSNQNSFALVAGEGNFLRQEFRACKISTQARDLCHAQVPDFSSDGAAAVAAVAPKNKYPLPSNQLHARRRRRRQQQPPP
ncbi:hypothetical protein CTAYLR_005656 [Chrysophaeum taylorii]|uniref:Uncharacterized protein n=1 Tax=Chrysophaeum taylorii TaxID=2483200 RepID=A0AAD7ULY8_9STRA|nr:hypothetical protein CTAYLR_005656 [Chrysophaeum taylorii]